MFAQLTEPPRILSQILHCARVPGENSSGTLPLPATLCVVESFPWFTPNNLSADNKLSKYVDAWLAPQRAMIMQIPDQISTSRPPVTPTIHSRKLALIINSIGADGFDYESAANRRRMGPRQFAICHGVYQFLLLLTWHIFVIYLLRCFLIEIKQSSRAQRRPLDATVGIFHCSARTAVFTFPH